MVSAVRACWICGKPCRLEDCKIDEQGLPVHEECYVAKLVLKKKVAGPPDVTPPIQSAS
jgi:hypothetical protein